MRTLALLSTLFIISSCSFKKAEPAQKLEAFHLSDVELLDSPFKTAMMADMDYILSMDMDRLLAPYLKEAGLEAKAENYTNWENTGLDGHIGGHYLSALAKMYAATGDKRFEERLNYMLSELERAQNANGNGYLSGVPNGKEIWNEIENGNIDAGSFSLNKRWVPLYNIHKIYAGLCDAYLFAGSEKAKDMLIELTNWAIYLVRNLSEEQIQDMLRSEHGGLNEVFANVAELTGEEKYLELAKQFSQQSILQPLIKHEDHLTGMHANTQIPKVIGFKRVADVDSCHSWDDAAQYFWENVVNSRSIAIGGNSVREHFHPTNDFSSMVESEQGPETCNTYNMLKLTKQLFLSNPQVRYIDYYERAMFNHILSTQDPETGGLVYFTPMRPGHYRVYSQPETSFWCCVGSGIENHTQYGELIYAHDNNDIYINLFVASSLNWEEKGIKLSQETNFPYSESSTITINESPNSSFNLFFRYPKWAKDKTIKVKVNGKSKTIHGKSGEYFALNQEWKKGDKIELSIPMHTTAEKLSSEDDYYAFLHGPIVLAAKVDTSNQKGLFADDSRGGHIASGTKYPLNEMPIIIGNENELESKLKPISGKPLSFILENTHSEKYNKLELSPFFSLHKARYSVYFKVISKNELEETKAATAKDEAEKKALASATIDLVFPGEQQPESDHFIKSEKSNSGIHNGKYWRDASGWFSYRLNDEKGEAKKLRIMYFGADAGRDFSISINEQKIAHVKLNGEKGNVFYTVDYSIPEAILAKAKGKFTVRFDATKGSVAGGVFEVRLMK